MVKPMTREDRDMERTIANMRTDYLGKVDVRGYLIAKGWDKNGGQYWCTASPNLTEEQFAVIGEAWDHVGSDVEVHHHKIYRQGGPDTLDAYTWLQNFFVILDKLMRIRGIALPYFNTNGEPVVNYDTINGLVNAECVVRRWHNPSMGRTTYNLGGYGPEYIERTIQKYVQEFASSHTTARGGSGWKELQTLSYRFGMLFTNESLEGMYRSLPDILRATKVTKGEVSFLP